MIPKIYLKKGKAKPFWYGHPLVFSGAVERIEGEGLEKGTPAAGAWVQVVDSAGTLIGYGVFNPHSSYRVRLLCSVQEASMMDVVDLVSVVSDKIQRAQQLRKQLQLPASSTNAYRLLNSEGDGLSGLTIDVFANTAVVSASAYWTQASRSWLEPLIKKRLEISTLYWCSPKKALAEDGWQNAHEHSAALEPSPAVKHSVALEASPALDHSSASDSSQNVLEKTKEEPGILIQENGVLYKIFPVLGQKTGFYCDQRENRVWVRRLAAGRRVLDLFCYNGGFSIHAALGGAISVTGVDSSAPAIAWAVENAKLNDCAERITFTVGDAMDVLHQKEDGVDFIILDPPKLAPSRKQLAGAMTYYGRLNERALERLPRQGLLLTCTCSSAMTPELFLQMVHEAAYRAKKNITVLANLGAGPDHPFLAAMPTGQYLQVLLVAVL